MLGSFAVLAAILAAIGIYGVLTYGVVQRTQEIGIRLALGAAPGLVLRSVLLGGFGLTAIGITLGLLGAGAVTRLLDGLLFGLSPLDPGTFAAVAVFFAAIAMTASFVPARRATRIDPMAALRSE
jgi:putative ABC transport system permease protein